MTIAVIVIVFVVAGGWLLYREPPKQRPGEALSRFDRLAQRLHDLIQGRWYARVAGTVVVLFAGLLVSQLFSSEPLTASTQTVTVTVAAPGAPSSSTSTHAETTTTPEPKPTHSVLGSWTGLAVDQNYTASKYQVALVVQTTKIDVDPAGTLTEKSLDGEKCEFLITATGKKANEYTFSARVDEGAPCWDHEISVERKGDGTVTYKSDFGQDNNDGVGTLRPS
jgi:cation diffusion facilitator CzcD-associated flavoprotein CzcO